MRKKRRKQQPKVVRTLCILTLSIGILAGCSDTAVNNADSNSMYSDQAPKSIKAFKVIKQKIGDPLERAAEAQSSAQFDITSKAAGDIDQILKKRGDMVQEGDVILRLRSGDLQTQRETAAIAVQTAQDAIEKAKIRAKKETQNQKLDMSNAIQKMELSMTGLMRNYNKMKNDYDIGLVTKAQLYQMETQMMSARMDLDQLKQKLSAVEPQEVSPELDAQLKNAQVNLQQLDQSMKNLEVRATVSGLLTEMPMEAGMALQAGAKVGVIQRLDPIKIKAQLSEAETNQIGNKTQLSYFVVGANEKYKGAISYLSKVIDPETKAYEINLEVPNKDLALKPGMKLKLQLTEEQDQIVVTVPTYSIVKEGDNAFVFVLNGDTVEKRSIQLGRLNEPNQEVLSGLKEGELVVKTSPSQLSNKQKVQMTAIEEQ
ncbi:efflux RND transporter periplasmic adaptor subunit [Paenibacillus chondroitinus]|uniref:Efflux RND transporter periplasmic adaptor subunit n=1 Tax=Paenibacillus chondroitinus TaxID=59842 RepID=A0ABU6DLI9_9BACL|nr:MULTISPECIES: efflux RND transporter periplasmic adaptor subunit [Paenibacillus]MCY9660231.1 efflux RND transporter periplasmic adaptor subunit [Paenibacillus anseongense]MEB4797657.1 efflux RND transporter periplasmic adaptor subunit [Paenibacillus chondroitinus]